MPFFNTAPPRIVPFFFNPAPPRTVTPPPMPLNNRLMLVDNVSSTQIQQCLDAAIVVRRNYRLSNPTWKGFYASTAGVGLFALLIGITAYIDRLEVQAYNEHHLYPDTALTCADNARLIYGTEYIDRERFNSTADYSQCVNRSQPAAIAAMANIVSITFFTFALVSMCVSSRNRPQFRACFEYFPNPELHETFRQLGYDLDRYNMSLDELIDELKELKQMKVVQEHELEVVSNSTDYMSI